MRSKEGEQQEIDEDIENKDLEKLVLQFLEANNSAAASIAKKQLRTGIKR